METVATIRFESGVRTGLITKRGPKYYHFITPDASGMRVLKVTKSLERYITEDPGYSVAKAKRILRRCVRNFGGTKEVKRALRG